jgi:hypothetical protein
MTTWTTEDRERIERANEEYDGGIPIPFAGWVADMDDKEQMLREQIRIQQNEIGRLRSILMSNGIPYEQA